MRRGGKTKVVGCKHLTRILLPPSLRSTIYSHPNDERPLLDSMGSSQEPPLDEIQWRSPQIAQSMTGIQTNTGSYPLCLQSLS